jgi:hypothetical protein
MHEKCVPRHEYDDLYRRWTQSQEHGTGPQCGPQSQETEAGPQQYGWDPQHVGFGPLTKALLSVDPNVERNLYPDMFPKLPTDPPQVSHTEPPSYAPGWQVCVVVY